MAIENVGSQTSHLSDYQSIGMSPKNVKEQESQNNPNPFEGNEQQQILISNIQINQQDRRVPPQVQNQYQLGSQSNVKNDLKPTVQSSDIPSSERVENPLHEMAMITQIIKNDQGETIKSFSGHDNNQLKQISNNMSSDMMKSFEIKRKNELTKGVLSNRTSTFKSRNP